MLTHVLHSKLFLSCACANYSSLTTDLTTWLVLFSTEIQAQLCLNIPWFVYSAPIYRGEPVHFCVHSPLGEAKRFLLYLFFLKLLFVSLVVRLVVNRQLHRNRNAWFFSIVTWDSKLIIGLNDKQFLHVFGGTHLQDCFQLVRRARDLVCFSRGTYSTPPRTNMGSLETEIPMDCQGPCYFLGV